MSDSQIDYSRIVAEQMSEQQLALMRMEASLARMEADQKQTNILVRRAAIGLLVFFAGSIAAALVALVPWYAADDASSRAWLAVLVIAASVGLFVYLVRRFVMIRPEPEPEQPDEADNW